MKSFQATAVVAMTAFGLAAAQSISLISRGTNGTTTTSGTSATSRASASRASASSRTSTTSIPASTPGSGNATVTNTPSINLFVNGLSAEDGYAASIVSACGDQTVYAIKCTSGPAIYEPSTCGPDAPVVTVTENPSAYIAAYATHGVVYGIDATVTISESCALQGTTAADCHATLFVSAEGQKTSSAVDSSLTGAAYHRYDVAITGGAEKTASATGKCTSGATYAADSRGVLAMAVVGALSLAAILAL